MAEPAAAPIASSSSTKIRKPKKSKEKSRRDKPAPHDTHAAAFGTPTRSSEGTAVHPTTPAHVAPRGRDPADYEVEFGDFDYDAVKAEEGAELWLVRAPTAVKAKNLQGLEISSRIGLVGDLMRKSTAYDLWALEPPVTGYIIGGGASTSGGEDQDEAGGTAAVHVGVSAEELGSLSVLLPRKRKGGKLYLSPKPVTRHLVVAARPAEPTKPDTASDSAVYQNPQREAYPEEVLKHRFRPYGDPGDPPPEHHTDVEMAAASTKEKEKVKPKRKGGEAGSSKKKKAKLAAS